MNRHKQAPKIAIITRTKDRNLLLERSIKSVLSQTYKDYVHVILNDGGDKEELRSLLDQYPDDKRVVIDNKQSVGITVALNQAIRAVDSKYVSILDDDDSWAPERLEMVVAHLESSKNPGAIVIMDRIIEKIEEGSIIEVSRNRWLEGVETVSLYKQCLDNYLSNGVFNYTRKVYEELEGYDEALDVAEDWDFGIRYMLKYDVDFIKTPDALMYYHHRPDQSGPSGNSVFAGIDNHNKALNLLQNKYLRQDIISGGLGIGYIMNNLRYERDRDQVQHEKNMAFVVRLEGHINFVADELKQHSNIATRVLVDSINSRLFRRVILKIKNFFSQ
ncbi:MAG: glycosyltransferase family 2 protein [Candidatus Saccharimonadales bacterium]